ncbi:MAG: hypothetical protein WDN69_08885 [Aliidongia sp.]
MIPALLPDGTKNPNNPYGQDITNANLRPFGAAATASIRRMCRPTASVAA